MSFLFTDDFNRADVELDGNFAWVCQAGTTFFKVVSNVVEMQQPRTSQTHYMRNTTTLQDDQWIGFKGVSGTTALVLIARDAASSPITQYQTEFTGSSWRLHKTVLGVDTILATDSSTNPNFNDEDTVVLECTGSSPVTLKIYRNGNLALSTTDTIAPITSGQPGFYMSATGNKLDNFVVATSVADAHLFASTGSSFLIASDGAGIWDQMKESGSVTSDVLHQAELIDV